MVGGRRRSVRYARPLVIFVYRAGILRFGESAIGLKQKQRRRRGTMSEASDNFIMALESDGLSPVIPNGGFLADGKPHDFQPRRKNRGSGGKYALFADSWYMY